MKQFDKLGPLFGRECRQKRQSWREQFALQAAPRLPCFVEQPGRRRLVCVRLGELDPGSAHQRFDRLAHLLHMRTKILGVSLECLPLLRIELELCADPLKPLRGARRESRSLNADPQGPGDETQIERQR
jgi:hypothetical protein